MRGTLEWQQDGTQIGPLEADVEILTFVLKDCVFITQIFTFGEVSMPIELGYSQEEIVDLIDLIQHSEANDHDSISDFEWDGADLVSRAEWVNGTFHLRSWAPEVHGDIENVIGHITMDKNETRRLMHDSKKSLELLENARFIPPDKVDDFYTEKFEKIKRNFEKAVKTWEEYLYGR